MLAVRENYKSTKLAECDSIIHFLCISIGAEQTRMLSSARFSFYSTITKSGREPVSRLIFKGSGVTLINYIIMLFYSASPRDCAYRLTL